MYGSDKEYEHERFDVSSASGELDKVSCAATLPIAEAPESQSLLRPKAKAKAKTRPSVTSTDEGDIRTIMAYTKA